MRCTFAPAIVVLLVVGEFQDENFLKNLPNMLDAAVDDLDNMLENLDSMTQEQLQQLSDMMSQMQQLEQLLNQYPFQGSQRMGMGEAGQLLGQMRGLERFLRWGQRGMGDPSELGLEEIRQLLGEEAYEHLKYLKGVEQVLEEEGYIVRTNHGLKLTPKGIRKIGDKALREIFQMLNKSRWGNHNTAVRGSQGDRLEETKKYEYGDPMNVNISETLLNALEKRKKGAPLKIAPEDFSVHRVEFSTASETALLIDVSYSMLMNDALHAGKKVALALGHLIRTQYPGDSLKVVLFHDSAEEIPLAMLATALLAALSNVPHNWTTWATSPNDAIDQLWEIPLFGAAGEDADGAGVDAADGRGAGRARRARSAPGERQDRRLHQRAHR